MDALLVFGPQNNLILIKCNKQFSYYLIEFAKENGIEIDDQIDVKDMDKNETFRNVLSVLLTPFVASQRYLRDSSEIVFDCIIHSKAVFSTRQEFFFLYIFGDTEKEIFMQRKVDVFAQIIQFIFGPSMLSIKVNYDLVEIAFNMIEKWIILSESITFMLESIERLLVGPELSSLCNNTLQHILSKIRSKSKSSLNETPCHTYLFHGLKYITSYSIRRNTSKITRGDMLLMLLLSHSIDSNNQSEDVIYNAEQVDIQTQLSDSNTIKTENSLTYIKKSNYHQFLVFLQTSNDPKLLVPYIYRKLTIEGDLFIIIISELPTQLSLSLSVIISTIDTLVNEPNEKRCCHTVIKLQNCIKRIKDYAYKNNLINDRTYFSTLNNLNKMNKSKIFEYITDLDQKLLSFQLEAQLSLINNTLRESYQQLVFDTFYRNLQISDVQTQHQNIFNEVHRYSKKTFNHYLGYFNVKSQRNMTLLGINVDIKDLIGFIYIDRTINELIIAPIECYDWENKEEIPLKDKSFNNLYNNDLRKVIKNMILHAYNSLIDGNLITLWNDQVLHYSYSMWFEDSSGSTLTPEMKNFKLHSYPSIISGNFIQHIINSSFAKQHKSKAQRKCEVSLSQKVNISCFPYELFCIYKSFSVQNEINVIENTKKLASKLSEIGISSEI